MNITKWDIGILIAMSITVITMSFVFPALGLGGDNVTENEIPDFNITTDRFGGYLDKPERPGAPSRGVINHTSSKFDDYPGSIQVELGKGNSGNRFFLVAIEENETHIVNGSILDNHTYNSIGEEHTLSGDGYTIDTIARDLDHGKFEYEVTQRPGDTTWYNSIPIVGGIFSTGEQLAATLAWIGSIIFYYVIQLGNTILNTAVIIFDLVSFFIGLMHWLIITYTGIIDSAPTAWVSVIIAIPGILLSIIFTKVIMVVVGLLPTT